jgi:hypothetical protein
MARQGFPSRWVGFPCPGPQTQCRRKRLKETVDMLARAAETKNGTGRKRLDGREEMTQRPEVYIMSLFVTFASNALSLVLQMIHATQLSPLIPGSQWIISGPSALVERAKEQLRQSGKLKSDKGDEELVVLGEKLELVSGLRLTEDVMRLGNTALSWSVSRLAWRLFVFSGFPRLLYHHLLPGPWSFLLLPAISVYFSAYTAGAGFPPVSRL